MGRFGLWLRAIVGCSVLGITWAAPLLAQVIGRQQFPLSQGQAVPAGQLEAVGTIPGCTATLVATRLVLTAAHCVCPSQVSASQQREASR